MILTLWSVYTAINNVLLLLSLFLSVLYPKIMYVPSKNIQAKAQRKKKWRSPATMPQTRGWSVWPIPARNRISATRRQTHRFLWIVVLSDWNNITLDFIYVPKKMGIILKYLLSLVTTALERFNRNSLTVNERANW